MAQEEICERFFEVAGQGIGVRVDAEGRELSPPQAAQHLALAEDAAAFGRWADAAKDPELAELAGRIADEAEAVQAELNADAPDAHADTVTAPLYRATTELYAVCAADAYRRMAEGGVKLTGACAEPGAPTLDGPNVVVYGSGVEFAESTCELRQGEPLGDGCSFSESGVGHGGEGTYASVEVAYDPDTCQALYESGRVSENSN